MRFSTISCIDRLSRVRAHDKRSASPDVKPSSMGKEPRRHEHRRRTPNVSTQVAYREEVNIPSSQGNASRSYGKMGVVRQATIPTKTVEVCGTTIRSFEGIAVY